MKSYKVEITQTDTYVVDVKAKNKTEAMKKAEKEWNHIAEHGMHHYHQSGDTVTDFGTIYDVTGTDDANN